MHSVLVFLLIGCLLNVDIVSAITEAQLKSAGKLVRKNCQPKTKASDESIDNMHIGVWDDLPSTKCYAFCVLFFYKLVNKKGVPDEEAARAQLAMLPKERQEPTEKSALACRYEGDTYTDKCDKAYAMLKCFYFDNPENYFVP